MRIDLSATVELLDFSPPIWEWIDLLGEIVAITQEETIERDLTFIARTDFDKLVLVGVNRQLRLLYSIYILIRFEYLDIAAAQVRMLCESLITLSFVATDKERLAKQFCEYYTIESFEWAQAVVALETHATPEHIASMEDWLEKQKSDYERLKPRYTQSQSRDRASKTRPRNYINWCNKNMPQQAAACGKPMERLYKLVYKQMSAYVHFSAFSMRHQIAYSSAHYDEAVVHRDIATVVRTTAAVWEAMCAFLEDTFGWPLRSSVIHIVEQVNLLDVRHFKSVGRSPG